MRRRFAANASFWLVNVLSVYGLSAQQLPTGQESARTSSTIYRDAVEGAVVSGSIHAPSGTSASLNYTVATAPKHGAATFADKTKSDWQTMRTVRS